MPSFFLKLFGEKRFVNSVNVFPASTKSINQVQKYLHFVESYACILKYCYVFILQSKGQRTINRCFYLFRNMCSTPKESK